MDLFFGGRCRIYFQVILGRGHGRLRVEPRPGVENDGPAGAAVLCCLSRTRWSRRISFKPPCSHLEQARAKASNVGMGHSLPCCCQ